MKFSLLLKQINVRNLYQLAQTMKEKMDNLAAIENCQNELHVCRAQLSEKNLEIQKLHQQVRANKRLQEKFEASKE